MKRTLVTLSLLMTLGSVSAAGASEFCDGFEAGFKSKKGEYALTPLCPLEPLIPYDSTAFKEGAKLGARKAGDGVTFDATTNNRYETTTDSLGNTTVNGSNDITGSTWTNKIMVNGNQSGVDAEGRTWEYNALLKTYTRSDGKSCSGVGTSYETCTGGRKTSQQSQYSKSCDFYGGECYTGYGGAAYAGYGGPCYSGYGGKAYAGYGGPCYEGYGSDLSQCPTVCK